MGIRTERNDAHAACLVRSAEGLIDGWAPGRERAPGAKHMPSRRRRNVGIVQLDPPYCVTVRARSFCTSSLDPASRVTRS